MKRLGKSSATSLLCDFQNKHASRKHDEDKRDNQTSHLANNSHETRHLTTETPPVSTHFLSGSRRALYNSTHKAISDRRHSVSPRETYKRLDSGGAPRPFSHLAFEENRALQCRLYEACNAARKSIPSPPYLEVDAGATLWHTTALNRTPYVQVETSEQRRHEGVVSVLRLHLNFQLECCCFRDVVRKITLKRRKRHRIYSVSFYDLVLLV
ncbi:hypothetical protein Trydic_g5226 [Trypoxylus dichotomus]